MYEIYKERFTDAGDFTFFLVGSFNIDSIKPLIQQYIGNLPNEDKKETWNNLGITPSMGIVKKEVYKGTEPKSKVVLYFDGPAVYSREADVKPEALGEILAIRLRETLREDAGGVYGVNVYAGMTQIPQQRYTVTVNFGCSPEKVDQLIKLVFFEINALNSERPEKTDLNKVLEMQRSTAHRAGKEWVRK